MPQPTEQRELQQAGLGASSAVAADRVTDAPHEAPSGSSPSGSVPTGAWRVSCVRRTMDGQRWLRIVSENDWEIAYVPFGDRTTDEYRRCTEHSRLIAAAPDLLRALAGMVDGDSTRDIDERYDNARAALNKALGK